MASEVSSPNNASLPTKPTPTQVKEFHTYADTDTDDQALHHTLGPGNNQAAAGTHDHKGANSVLLFDGIAITGSRGTATCVPSIIALLVQFGADDQTTA
jgi:hypothetical protein